MQIVINIPEELYDKLMTEQNLPEGYDAEYPIIHGIPLPKGHGDLIDRKALMNRPYETGGFVDWYDEIKYAPTIIPADKGE